MLLLLTQPILPLFSKYGFLAFSTILVIVPVFTNGFNLTSLVELLKTPLIVTIIYLYFVFRNKKVNKVIFPGIQGGPLMHVIAAKAQCFYEALQPEFKEYQKQVIKNAKVLCDVLKMEGFKIVKFLPVG